MERSRWGGFIGGDGNTFTASRINRILDLSPERFKTKNRKRHAVNTTFKLVFNHSHQSKEETAENPAMFLACAKNNESSLMNIKYKDGESEGDAIGAVICQCNNQTKIDKDREATFQQYQEGEKLIIPKGAHVVDSRAVFFVSTIDKVENLRKEEVFLVRIAVEDLNQQDPMDFKSRLYRSMKLITKGLRSEE